MTIDASAGARLTRLFRPESIAVVGGGFAELVANQCDGLGFQGQIWPVHPKRSEMAGRKCFPSVADLPSAPDAAFLGVNRNVTVEVVGALSQMGAGGAVCHASGFRESGEEGIALQDELVEAAGPMPIIGPNCVGVLNYLDGVGLWPEQHGGLGVERGVAIITQSGNVGINITQNQRALSVAYVVTVGNQANVGLSEVAAACLEDDRVSAIGLYVEGVDNAQALDEVARRALEVKKPIVALKVGASSQSNRIALRHTASVTGSFEVFHAFCNRVGIAHVRSLAEFIETLNLVSVIGPLKGNRISSMSASGGEASLIADAAIGRDLVYPQMEQQHHDEVQSTLPGLVVVSNPFDYHTFTWGDRPRMTRTYEAMLGGGFDLSLLVLDWPREDRCDAESYHIAVESWIAAVEETGAPTAVMASFHEGLTESVSSKLHAAGVATLRGMTEGLAAVEAAWHLGRSHRSDLPAKLLVGDEPPHGNEGRLVDRPSANKALSAGGVPTPQGGTVTGAEEAVRAAEGLGYPVVVKLVDPSKAGSSPGASAYEIFNSAAAVRDAVTALGDDEPLLVEEAITDGIAHLAARIEADPQFGFFVAIRSGGELAEISDDEQILLLPAGRNETERAVGRLRTAPVLRGLNGRPPGDIDALVDCLLDLARFTETNKGRLARLDISPLIVRPRGLGVVASDALIRWM